jgi:hypothetical protein
MFKKDDKIWFKCSILANKIGIIDYYYGEGWYIVTSSERKIKHFVFLTDITYYGTEKER